MKVLQMIFTHPSGHSEYAFARLCCNSLHLWNTPQTSSCSRAAKWRCFLKEKIHHLTSGRQTCQNTGKKKIMKFWLVRPGLCLHLPSASLHLHPTHLHCDDASCRVMLLSLLDRAVWIACRALDCSNGSNLLIAAQKDWGYSVPWLRAAFLPPLLYLPLILLQ